MNTRTAESIRAHHDCGKSRPAENGLDIGLLGPLHVTVNGAPVPLTAGRLRSLLAALALSAGRSVPVDRLGTAIWAGDDTPGNVRRSLQTYVARLRAVLGGESIGSTPTGYVLRVAPDHVDALRFVRLVGEASGTTDTVARRACLAEALNLWRGRPLEGVPSDRLREAETPWLVERYLAALEARLDLDISAGRHGELVAELSELTTRHPLRESLWARLLIALDRSGRRAEALERYETIRTRVAAEFGVDPDPALQRIHLDLLRRSRPQGV